MLKILEELPSNNTETSVMGISSITADENRLTGYFCKRRINEPELRSDFGEFWRRMWIKWHFCNEPTLDFSEKTAFHTKSSWNSPKGDPHLKVFLSRVEEELFTVIERRVKHSNLSQEGWKAIRSLADDRNIVIKKAQKDSCVIIWDRNDYITEAEKQLSEKILYKEVCFNEKNLYNLVEISNRFFRGLKLDGHIW